MQPLKPEQVEQILQTRPGVTREHIREYEKLTVHRLEHRQRPVHAPHELERRATNERRRRELHQLLFGTGPHVDLP